MQPSDQIKEKLDIVDVLREYIQLKAAGMNFRARCPFHREKTPSFMVSPDKQIWHCFGCGEGGDIFSFVMKMEGIDFKEALRLLAPKAGVTLKREDPRVTSQRNRLLDINDLARRYYHQVLLEAKEAAAAREYLKKRGLTQETIEEWQIGYSPDAWETLTNVLKKRGYKENEIFLAGLSVKSNNRPGYYDRFRGRIMFPINDINANAVGFTARVSPDKEASEKMGKYINSPQTQVYDKSKLLFGLDKAKLEIKKQDMAIIVEGQMDVITAHQHGYRNVIASSGTALTTEQVALLKRYSQNLALAFDMDEAGALAAERGIREAMQAEMNIKVIQVPAGKDPDECIRHNPKDWEQAVREAKPMMEFFLDRSTAGLDLSQVENKRQVTKVLLPVLAKLANKIEQDHWLRQLSQKLDVAENLLRETLLNSIRTAKAPKSVRTATATPEPPRPKVLTRDEKISELMLALLLKFPELLEYALKNVEIGHIAGQDNKSIYKNLILYYNNIINQQGAGNSLADTPILDYYDFKEWLNNSEANPDFSQDQSKILDRLVLLGEKDYFEFTGIEAKEETIRLSVLLRKSYLRARMKEIEKEVAVCERNSDNEKMKNLMDEFKVLSDEFNELSAT